jgi:hypothetical protein
LPSLSASNAIFSASPFRQLYTEINLDNTQFKFPVLAFNFPVSLKKFPSFRCVGDIRHALCIAPGLAPLNHVDQRLTNDTRQPNKNKRHQT